MHMETDSLYKPPGLRGLRWWQWIAIAVGLIFGAYMLVITITGHGMAADLAVRKAQPVAPVLPPAMYTWNGFYIGPKFGYGLTDPLTGAAGGVQLGYDWQAGGLVIGLVGDINAANFSGNGPATVASTAGTVGAVWSSRTNWYSTEDVRLGIPIGPLLLYGMAGAAEGGQTMNVTGAGAFNSRGFGWNGGGGVEWRISQTTSLMTQFKHIDIGNVSCPVCVAPGSQKFAPNVWETGINFHF